MTRPIFLLMAVLTIGIQCTLFTLPLPFLSSELTLKQNYSSTVSGIVVGLLPLSACLSSLFVDKFTTLSTPKTLILSIPAILGTTTIFYLPLSRNVFLAAVVISRIVHGTVNRIIFPKEVAFMSQLYPEKLGMVTALFELAFSGALAVGPLIGGHLYNAWGYAFSMALLGGSVSFASLIFALMLSFGPLKNNFVVPLHAEDDEQQVSGDVGQQASGEQQLCGDVGQQQLSEDNDDEKQVESKHRLLNVNVVILGVCVGATVGGVEGYVSSFLSVYLKQNYGKPESLTGTVLLVTGAVYSLSTAVTGLIIDKGFPKSITIIFGLALLATSTLFLDLKTVGIDRSDSYLWCCVVFGLLEGASAMVNVSVLPLLVAHYHHPNQELRTERMTGVYISGFYGGAFLGPIIGGGVLSFTSYPASFGVMAGIAGVALLLVVVKQLGDTSLLCPKNDQ